MFENSFFYFWPKNMHKKGLRPKIKTLVLAFLEGSFSNIKTELLSIENLRVVRSGSLTIIFLLGRASQNFACSAGSYQALHPRRATISQ